jgi:hypothetical protein
MDLLNVEKERFKNVTVDGKDFKIRCMSPRDKVTIAQRRMKLQNGNPVEAMMNNDFMFFENIAIVDTCTESFPADFKNNQSCIDWPDESLIHGLAEEIRKHTIDFDAKLKKNRPVAGGEEP